jgi:hypothetical protein
MLTTDQIVRLVDARAYAPLLQRVFGNGRCPCRAMLLRLSENGRAPAAALGLGLQRMVELTYRPGDEALPVTARLLGMQAASGLFGGEDGGAVGVTAAALRGLLEWLDHSRADDDAAASLRALAFATVQRGLAALASRQRRCGSMGDGPVDAAIVLWQLRGRPESAAIRWSDLSAWLDSARAGDEDLQLTRFARAAA